MKIIVGLGNPGEKYKHTRHNAWFLAIDYLLNEGDDFISAKPSHEFKSEVYTWQNGSDKVIFLKPQTYMNDSGQALKVVCNFYKISLASELLIVHDEVDLPFGTVRGTDSASAAGHKGVQSIIDNLGSQDFHRLRIGVESRVSREDMPTDAFVLQNFSDDELKKFQSDVLPEAKKQIENFIKH